MGKTSVALTVFHEPHIVHVFGNNRYWVPCDEKPTIPLLLDHLVRMFAVTLKSGILLNDLVLHLRENNAPRIILLDNFETVWDRMETKRMSEDILSSLGSIPNITILLTMRGSLPPSGVQWTELPQPEIGPLSLNAARDTFKGNNPYYNDDWLDDLLHALDYWPLAITLVAKVGRQSKAYPSELLSKWEEEKTALLYISPDHIESVDISIGLSLQSRPMVSDPDALTLLSVLACLPGGTRPENLQHVTPTMKHVNASLRILLGASLAEYTPDKTLKVLSPIRAYMQKYHPLDSSNTQALRMFYFQLVEAGKHNPKTKEFQVAFQLLSREGSNIQSIIMNALENQISIDAVQATIHYSHYLYWNVPSTELLNKAINLIPKQPSNELDFMMPHCLLRLGMLSKRMDDFSQAVTNLNESKQQFELLGNPSMAAECCLQLAHVYMMQAKLSKAIVVLDTARNHSEAIKDENGISDYFEVLGRVYRRQGQYIKAAAALNKSKAICKKLDDKACVAIRAHYLGLTYRTEGKLDDAIIALNEADAYFNQAFVPPYYVANNIYNLGVVYYMQQHYDKADATLAQAYDSFITLGNYAMISWSTFHQAELHRMQGHLRKANELFAAAMDNFEKMRWTEGVIHCHLGQARVFTALYQVNDARESCSHALTLIGDQEGYIKIPLDTCGNGPLPHTGEYASLSGCSHFTIYF
jgi:tetratricopeptide (TPR) repeat protein